MSLQAEEPLSIEQPDLNSISSPSLFLKAKTSYHNAPLLDTKIDVAITGMIAKVMLKQTFENTSTDWVEGLYTFPLPDQAAVNSLIVTIGDRRIVGSIREKKQAEQHYEQAKQAGKLASIVKQHRPNLFSSRFANIPPGETVSIELGYVQTVAYVDDQYSLRIPLTLTERYSGDYVPDKTDISPPQLSASAANVSMGLKHGVEIKALLHGLYDVSDVNSPSHDLIVSPIENGTEVILNETAVLDRDFILHWREAAAVVPTVRAWRERVAGEEYLLATVTPPTSDEDIPEQARELILVIDTSGSMAGEPMRAAKTALLDALNGLTPNDYFNIIEFDSQYSTLFNQPMLASAQNIQMAEHFTRGLNADGGTEMLGALQNALGYQSSNLLRQVVFITDGAVGYEDQVFESVSRSIGDIRLFTVGIGSAPNEWFMRKVAEAGRGTYQLIQNVGDVQDGMSTLLRKLESPALTSVVISFDGDRADITPDPIPDLYASEPLVIAARLVEGNHTMTVAGTWGDELWQTSVSVDNAPITNTGLSTVWARKKIESLQDKQRFNSDPDFYRSLILRLSLDHQILSPYTAFLAVEDTPVRPANELLAKKVVPNLHPAGTQNQSFALPQGSLGIDTLLLFSFFMMLCGLLFSSYPKALLIRCRSL